MIVVTGAAGFIGSVVASALNKQGYHQLVLVDDFKSAKLKGKTANFITKTYTVLVERDDFFDWFPKNAERIKWVIHLGARTDTTEFNKEIFDRLNVNYSKTIWQLCSTHQIPLIYASSAATYGMGEHGYIDSHEIVEALQPLNPYGISKNEFDKWVLQQNQPPFWAGLKFFNVYGPNEYHKGRMASVIFHAYKQIIEKGSMKLFRSHRNDFKDGEQLRDFVYVKDVAEVILFLMNQQGVKSGIYNLGTGKARSFVDLATACFNVLDKAVDIEFVDTPEDIRNKYQYFTEADMTKLKNSGYTKDFTSLEDGIRDYITNYLKNSVYF